MKIVEDFEFSRRGSHGKYAQLYKDFLALPYGTAVMFTAGEDFDVEPDVFRTSLRAGLWNKGYKTKITVREDGVYAMVVGPRNNNNDGSA